MPGRKEGMRSEEVADGGGEKGDGEGEEAEEEFDEGV